VEPYKQKRRAVRETIFDILTSVGNAKIELDKDKSLARRFIRQLHRFKRQNGINIEEHPVDFSLELVALAIEDNSRPGRKTSSKWARVVDFLLDQGTPPKKFREALKSRKGIAATYQESVRARQNAGASGSPPPPPPKRPVNRETKLTFRIRPSDRERLLEDAPIGCNIEIAAVRVGKEDDAIKITKIRILGSDPIADDDDAAAWAA
jgi:hypothetical protein